jgi:hypothetical protein
MTLDQLANQGSMYNRTEPRRGCAAMVGANDT